MRAQLIATLTREPGPEELAALAGRADVLEVRADLLPELEAEALRAGFPGRLLYTLRSAEEGGAARLSAEARRRRLKRAAAGFDLVDLEGERDLEPSVLRAIPADKRIVSWHGPSRDLDGLRQQFGRLAGEPAHAYKLVPEASEAREALAPLALLKSLGRRDVIAFAAGEGGTWTRFLAPQLGAPLLYVAAGEEPAAPGQLGIERLLEDFGVPSADGPELLFGIIGSPVRNSLSPRLHNACYRERGVAALYLPFDYPVFGDFWLDLVDGGSLAHLGFRLGGLSVTTPFKEIAQAVAGASSPLAERIGSANTLVWRSGVWEAESTDPHGVVGPLRERALDPRGLEAAVVGAGGAGRAATFGLKQAGARVRLVNRGAERGRRVARELGVDFVPFSDFDPGAYQLLVNATPLGGAAGEEAPFAPEALADGAAVVDLAYRCDAPTELVRRSREAGRPAVDGREVLLHQAVPQFLLMTGEELPLELARRLLGLEAPA